MNSFKSLYQLHQPFPPAGDQTTAITKLVHGIQKGFLFQTLLGVTGSGKTYTMANVIACLNRPAIIFAPNKTLAAQLYGEFRNFFPNNAVEYFVSYYDYYQPEAYIPQRDLFIEKDSSINQYIEQMRLSCTKSLMERRDVIVIATVSAIYGIGNPNEYHKMILVLRIKNKIKQEDIIIQLIQMQYRRNDINFCRGTFRVRGNNIDIFPAEHSKLGIRIEIYADQINKIRLFDHLTGLITQEIIRFVIYPNSHYVIPHTTLLHSINAIKKELQQRLNFFRKENKLIEAQRLKERVCLDIEMMMEIGFTKGIENYSRHLSGTKPGAPPSTLIDYLQADTLMFFDESHILIGQLHAMYNSDFARKTNLVNYGFRLPSALDNRPLKFSEFENKMGQVIFVSATPANYEYTHAKQVVEQIVRPTGLLDPLIFVRKGSTQIDDLISEIILRIKKKERILVTTLTKRMAEQLSEFLNEHNIKVRYLHSEIDTIERVEIIRNLRLGTFDVLVGINLLREGLDIPEVSLVAILDADKEGFLRSERSLIQTIGRAARHLNATAILYGDKITNSMRCAINETQRRRAKQITFNLTNKITPIGIKKEIYALIDGISDSQIIPIQPTLNQHKINYEIKNEKQLSQKIQKMEKLMQNYAKNLEFEKAVDIRNQLCTLKLQLFGTINKDITITV